MQDSRTITAVVGPMRSGTSCVTGLLERCGFDLGTTVVVSREPSEHNPRGHFESGLAHAINMRLVLEAKGGHGSASGPPDAEALAGVAAERDRYFDLLTDRFDGDLIKDPLFSLLWHEWEERWPALRQVVYCLRHPAAVARSAMRRYHYADPNEAVRTWSLYAERFFAAPKRSRVVVFDFDAFSKTPVPRLRGLLAALGRPRSEAEIRSGLEGFYDPDAVHWREEELTSFPGEVGSLYRELCAQADRDFEEAFG